MKNLLNKFRRDEDGAAAVEYGIILLVVILVFSAGLITVAQDTSFQFGEAAKATTDVKAAVTGTGTEEGI